MQDLALEALKAGPVVLVMWVLLHRLEIRVTKFQDDLRSLVDDITLIKVAVGDKSRDVEIANLKSQTTKLEGKVEADARERIEFETMVRANLKAIWAKVGDRPEDKEGRESA